ncbi:hypothetical protein HUJ05_001834 [Dendroctonus ponderosae]|nr:hypothetical protein HUJ05_001834 [Dendroctonus ponderosae]
MNPGTSSVPTKINWDLFRSRIELIKVFDGDCNSLNKFIQKCDNLINSYAKFNDSELNQLIVDSIQEKLIGKAELLPVNIQSRPLPSRQYPTNSQVFGKPQNVFRPNQVPQNQLPRPTPMSLTTRTSNYQFRKPNMPNNHFTRNSNPNQRNFISEESIKMMKITVMILALHLVNANDVQFTQIQNPLLPMQLKNAKIIYTKHTLLHYIDLEILTQHFIRLKFYYNKLKLHLSNKSITNPISYQASLDNILFRTEYLTNVTENKLQNLYPNFRQKRGLLNIVGQASKWLFGILDNEDGKKYNQAISKLQLDQKNLINHVNDQISLSKHLIKNFNKTITILDDNQRVLQKSVNLLTNTVDNKINNLQSYLTFQSVLSQINLDCQNLITYLDNLEDAIMFAKLNTLHNSIISIPELKEIINQVKLIYESDAAPNFRDILYHYQYFGTQVTFANNKIIFAIHVPIIKPETFSFHHLYPIIQNQTIIIPKYPYMVQAEQSTQLEETSCPELEQVFYCQEELSALDECSTKLLKNQQINNCQINQIAIEDTFAEQITQEEVIAIPVKDTNVLSKCGSNKYSRIHSPTLIRIPINCEIIIGKKKFTNNVRFSTGKPFFLPTIKLEEIPKSSSKTITNLTRSTSMGDSS